MGFHPMLYRIVATYDPPPIPWRNFDWCAYFDDLGADASPHGWGETQDEAIDDLLERANE